MSNSKLSEVESRIQSLSNDMEYARKEWNDEKIGDSSRRGTQGERRLETGER